MPRSLCDLIAELEKRPGMFVGNEVTLARINAFLNGWIIGMADNRASSGSHVLDEFNEYVSKKFDIPAGYGWERIIALVSEKGNAAPESFFNLFNEYIEQR